MAKNNSAQMIIFRLAVAVFFIALGLLTIMAGGTDGMFSLSKTLPQWAMIIIGIIELVCGIFIFMGFFNFIDQKVVAGAAFLIMVLWAARIVMVRFIWGIGQQTFASMASALNWVLALSCELVILAGLLVLSKRWDNN